MSKNIAGALLAILLITATFMLGHAIGGIIRDNTTTLTEGN